MTGSWDIVKEEDRAEVEFIKLEEGITQVRIIGGPVRRWSHWINSLNRSYTCGGKDCPVCEINKAEREISGKNKHGNQKRYIVKAIDREDGVLKVLEGSQALFDNLLMMQSEVGNLDTYDVKINRKGKKMDTTWGVIPQQVTPLTEEELAMIEESPIDMDYFLEAPTKEQWLDLLDGKDPSEVFGKSEEDDEENEEVDEEEDVDVDFTI